MKKVKDISFEPAVGEKFIVILDENEINLCCKLATGECNRCKLCTFWDGDECIMDTFICLKWLRTDRKHVYFSRCTENMGNAITININELHPEISDMVKE